MTVGYVDYTREDKQAGALIFSGSAVGNVTTESALFYCGTFQYLIITVDTSNSTHLWGVTSGFYTAKDNGTALGNTVSGFNAGVIDSSIVRVRGPWVTLALYNWDASNTDTMNYYVYGTNAAPLATNGLNQFGQWAYYNANIPASTTETLTPVGWHNGTAQLTTMSSVLNTMVISVDQYEYHIGWQTYINLEGSSTNFRSVFQEIPIPPIPVRFRLVNQSTAQIAGYFLAAPKNLVTV